MKIGIDISQVVYSGSGISTYTGNLVKTLLKIDRENQYLLFASVFRKRDELNNYLKQLNQTDNYSKSIYPFPPMLMNVIWNQMHVLPIELFTGHIDIFHTSDWTEPPSSRPKITTIHDLMIYKYPQYLDKNIVDTQKSKLKWVVKESQAIITDSQSTKNDLMQILKIQENKIHVVYLGINDIFCPQSEESISQIRKKYHISGSYFLCLGVNDPRKNFPKILQAFNQIKSDNIQLIGINSFLTAQKETDRGFKILNYVDPSDLPVIYSGAKAFIYPSLYEGFGLPVLEAMACGTLVITSDKGSLREIVGKAGIVVNPESISDLVNAINLVKNMSDADKKKLTEQGLDHTKNFTWEKTAAETLQIYKNLI